MSTSTVTKGLEVILTYLSSNPFVLLTWETEQEMKVCWDSSAWFKDHACQEFWKGERQCGKSLSNQTFQRLLTLLPSPLCWKTPFRHLLHSTIVLSFSKLASSPQLWFMWNISHRFVFLSTEFPDKSAWERGIVGSLWWCWTCQGFLEDQHGCKPLSQILPWLLIMMGYVLSSYELEQILLRSLSTGVREVIVPEAVKMNSTFRYRGTHLLSVHSQVNGFQCRIPCLFCSVLCV